MNDLRARQSRHFRVEMVEAAGVGAARARRSRDQRHRTSPPPHKKIARAKLGHFLVEAAGVEPASENTSSQSTTCVSPFDSRGRLRTEPSAPPASPDSSHPRASRRNAGTSLLNDGQSQATGLLKLTAHWFLSSESVVCVRSYVCFSTGLTRTWSLGTRSAIPHPRRSQIAPVRSEPRIAIFSLLGIGCSRFSQRFTASRLYRERR